MSGAPDLAARIQRLEDVEAIRLLKAAYCNGLDGGWDPKGPSHMGAVADLFTDDGVWDGTPWAPRSEGREAIRQMLVGYGVVPWIVHVVTNPVIDVRGDEADGHWHVIVATETVDGVPQLICGTYDEKYARTPEGWRFRSLTFTSAGLADQVSGWRNGPPPT